MSCRNCKSERIANVCSKANDLQTVTIGGKEHQDYLPRDLGIGGGDYVQFQYCLDCGAIQGTFPLPPTELEAEKQMLCDECGQPMVVDADGIANHIDDDGKIDHDQDALHVAYTTEE